MAALPLLWAIWFQIRDSILLGASQCSLESFTVNTMHKYQPASLSETINNGFLIHNAHLVSPYYCLFILSSVEQPPAAICAREPWSSRSGWSWRPGKLGCGHSSVDWTKMQEKQLRNQGWTHPKWRGLLVSSGCVVFRGNGKMRQWSH